MADLNSTLVRGSLRVTEEVNGGPATFDGQNTRAPLILKNGISSYREGLRIMPYGDWSDILLAGNDASLDQGTSANSWFIGNNNGNFHITRNGSSDGGAASLKCVNNVWSVNSYELITSGNIGSQSVNYATSAGDADTVNGYDQSDFLHINGGGTLSGTPYINFPASAASLSDSQPFGITYGRIQSYDTIKIAADTDGSTTEYVILTAGYGVANATAANGLAVGYNSLKWKGNDVIHTGNISNWALQPNKPSYNFSEIQPGTAVVDNGGGIVFRNETTAWYSGIYYSTPNEEAVIFANKSQGNQDASYQQQWLFAYTDMTQREAWTSLGNKTAMQIKGHRVAINQMYGSNVQIPYNLDVNGTANATTLYENGTALSNKYYSVSNPKRYIEGSPSGPRNFESGTLITTSIDYSVTNGDAFYLEIKADGYGAGSYFTVAQGYIYNDTIINYTVNQLGNVSIDHIYAMNVDGKLCFWFSRQAYWQSFSATCNISSSSDYYTNYVTSIIDSTKPNGTKEVELTGSGHNFRNINTGNIALQSVNSADYSGCLDIETFSNEDSAMPSGNSQFKVFNGVTSATGADGHVLGMTWHNGNYGAQLYIDTDQTYNIALRQRSSGGTWNAWVPILTSNNIYSYAVTSINGINGPVTGIATETWTGNNFVKLDGSNTMNSAGLKIYKQGDNTSFISYDYYGVSFLNSDPNIYGSGIKFPSVVGTNNTFALTSDIPNVPSWALQSNKPTYYFNEIYDRGEAWLDWGGRSLVGTFAPIDASLVSQLSANRVAGIDGSYITIERSNDSGSTWTEVSANDFPNYSRKALFTTSSFIPLRYGSQCQTSDRLRITMDATNGGIYTAMNKIMMYVSTSGSSGCNVHIDTAFYNSPTEWHDVGDYTLSGWSGWNVINLSLPGTSCLGGSNAGEHNRFIRLTFSCTGVDTTYTDGLEIYKIYMFGGVGWSTPSVLAREGVPYTYDQEGNVTIPEALELGKNLYFYGTQHRISREDGTTLTRYNGATVPLPNYSGKGIAILADEASDFGLFYVGSDGALLVNSGDTGYVLRVHDKDTGTDILQVCQTGGTSAFNSDLTVAGSFATGSQISEAGTLLSNKYLGINANAVSASIPYGFSSNGSGSDWSGVPGTMVTDWATNNSADIMFKETNGYLNVITDGRFYQGIDIYGSSQRVLDEYDISHTTWGNAQYAGSAGNTPLLLYQDTRDAVVSVSDAVDYNGIKIEFKNKTASSIPSTGTWTALITLDGYSDASGGYPSQLGFSMSDLGADRHLYMRSPVDGSTWGAWKTFAFHGDNISVFNNDSGYITSSGSCSYATSAGSVAWSNVSGKPSFATVATSGSYNDLSNKPTIPATNVIPAIPDGNHVLLSTAVAGTAYWSNWSTQGFLMTDNQGVVSPSDKIQLDSFGGLYLSSLNIGAPGVVGISYIRDELPSGQLPKNQTFYLPYMASGDGGVFATQYWVGQQGYTSNVGTVTSVTIQTGTGLTGGSSTAATATGSWTIGIDSNYKLPTTTEWDSKSSVSGTNDGTNWTSITIDGTTKNIPSGGGSTTHVYEHVVSLRINYQVFPLTVYTTSASNLTLADIHRRLNDHSTLLSSAYNSGTFMAIHSTTYVKSSGTLNVASGEYFQKNNSNYILRYAMNGESITIDSQTYQEV